ncbi:MAG: alpha-1,6-glucosidase domain-containing protein [Pseudobdellovibrionaceae bacterium]
MRRICNFIFIILLQYFPSMAHTYSQFITRPATRPATGTAIGVRAQWLSPSRLLYKLPPGTYISKSTQFFLMEGDQSVKTGSAISLPLISLNHDEALLDTSILSFQQINSLLSRALKVFIVTDTKQVLDSSAIQYSGLLDELYYYEGPDLGGNCTPNKCSLKLWAPTAQRVRVFLFSNAITPPDQAQILNMNPEAKGVWNLSLPIEFKDFYYLYEVQVYQPFTDRIETTLVTDPYSKSLSLNGTRSQLVDLSERGLSPSGWENLNKPVLNNLKESVIYELHIRDFSANDSTVPEELRGTYLAFTESDSAGMRHLRSLAEAGLTHLHLLPFNDFGSVNEDKTTWEYYESKSPNLKEPQSVISGIRAKDPFNWGYDPVHYLTPEGSYALNGEGSTRVLEVRQMVKALNEAGLRVVQDVVFNHTYENALDSYSVFDKIVPLYYYRVDDQGQAYRTSCCFDTATEHRMMEKLMIDAVLHWAKTYKIDGFRFDLMSFHSVATMDRLQQALRSLTMAKDGVDGSKILLYGEGWSFGSLFNFAPKESMNLENSYGTNFGFFNDRLRDAIRGGTSNSTEKSDQGFATGLFFDFNQEPANRNTPTDEAGQRDKLLHLGDVIKTGLAGNLRDFSFKEHLGSMIQGGDLRFRGSPVGVASQALETINFASVHDGYTLWDSIQAKAPFHPPGRNPEIATSEERQRVQQLALAIPLLSQGIPFLEGGSDLLRSKNGDQDSFDSGDFFNRIDWTGTTNYWGEGLPPAWRNIDDWALWEPRLTDPGMKVTPDLIAKTHNYVKALLRIRKSSRLFQLNTLEEISRQLSFVDNETQPEPGLIAMLLQSQNQNPNESLLIFFNASRYGRDFSHRILLNDWGLHPLLDEKVDPALVEVSLDRSQGRIHLPGRSTVILKINTSQKGQR